jgi:hypothetical protein
MPKIKNPNDLYNYFSREEVGKWRANASYENVKSNRYDKLARLRDVDTSRMNYSDYMNRRDKFVNKLGKSGGKERYIQKNWKKFL